VTELGRIRSALRFALSVGGSDGSSPIARESERTALLREHNELIRQQREVIAGQYLSVQEPVSADTGICPSCGKSVIRIPGEPTMHIAMGESGCGS
jgi:hypothetical protein